MKNISDPVGNNMSVGPVEMDEAGRIFFRLTVPDGENHVRYARVVMEGLGGVVD